MAGHSKWAQIKRAKGAADAKRGQLFTKLGHAIAIAARGGADPETNFSLRLAVDKAKQANMPAVNIQRSIDRGAVKLGGEQIQEVVYEGYGPGGVGILVECATDNINRTYPEVKAAFTKNGGNIAEKGAVSYQFERKGVIRIKGSGEEQMLEAIDAGAEDVVEDQPNSELVVYTDPRKIAEVKSALEKAGHRILEAELTYSPKVTVEIADQLTADRIVRLMEALEDLDDVTATHTNFDITQ